VLTPSRNCCTRSHSMLGRGVKYQPIRALSSQILSISMSSKDISFCFLSIKSFPRIVSFECIFAKDSKVTSLGSSSSEGLRLAHPKYQATGATTDNSRYASNRNTTRSVARGPPSNLVDCYAIYLCRSILLPQLLILLSSD